MATPFSPFVGRQAKPIPRRRQSQLPSDLIDWDAPEIPELEKQKIIYEDHIKDLEEEHAIDELLNEHIFLIAHDTIIESMVEKFQNKITEKDSIMERLQGDIAQKDSMVVKLQQDIANEESRIKKLQDDITKSHSIVERLKNDIAEKDSMVVKLQEDAANGESMIKKLQDDVTKGHSMVNLLLGQIKMFEASLEESEKKYDSLKNGVKNKFDHLREKVGFYKENLYEK